MPQEWQEACLSKTGVLRGKIREFAAIEHNRAGGLLPVQQGGRRCGQGLGAGHFGVTASQSRRCAVFGPTNKNPVAALCLLAVHLVLPATPRLLVLGLLATLDTDTCNRHFHCGNACCLYVLACRDITFPALIFSIAAVLHEQQPASRVVRQQQRLFVQKTLQDTDM